MRDWLNSLLGQDGGRVAQFALALVAVVLLILLVFWVIRRLQPGARLVAATGGKARKRLGVLEASDVDTKRRLVLVRRDDVEHLIMIGGPNDLLIESRILRSGQGQTVSRPNVQQMPRPGSNADPDRYMPAVPTTAATAPQTSPQPMVRVAPEPIEPVPSVQLAPAQPDPAPVAEPRITPPMAPPPFMPQPFPLTASRAQAEPITPTPAPATPPEPRRPSLNDLLSAATAAKAGERRDLPQPIPAPPPTNRPKLPRPDLEEDDRELPTQVVAYRPPTPPHVPQVQPAHHPTDQVAQPEAPTNRETDVATQIERALSDLNPLIGLTDSAPVRADTRPETALPPRRPVPPPTSTSPPQAMTAPILRAPTTPTMPPIPPRPVPPPRAAIPERMEAPPATPIPQELQHQVAELATGLPAPLGVAEPVTAPRPVTASLTRPVATAAPDPTPLSPARQKTDELEEEMAKLLSELGGSPQR